jgi:Sap, sulfolipid-1-addressing protein
MATILALAIAAAVYPQLLAIVIVILTRPDPRPLLWACYLGAVLVSASSSMAFLLVFRDRSSLAGSTSHHLGASVYLVVGGIALFIAILTASERGRAFLGSGFERMRRPGQSGREPSASRGQLTTRAKEAVSGGSVAVAGGVGAVLGIPGPFDLLALGHLVRGDYSFAASIPIVVVLILVKFLLIEIPIASYAIDPDRTAARVDRFSAWMRAHRVGVIATVVGVVGLVLIARGIARLS